MFAFIVENWGTIVTALVLLGIVAAILGNIVRKKRRGESAMCSGCSGCSEKNHCSAKQQH